jgi:PPOX class probable F420-dependent enzyme
MKYIKFLSLIRIMSTMTKDEIRNFLLQGTLTGKLGTINKNGTTHVVPIWYTLDLENNIVFNTGGESVKAKNIRRDNRVRLCVDDQTPLFSFVLMDGIAQIERVETSEIYKWAKTIAARYMGDDKSEAYGKRNSGEGEILVRIKPIKIIGQKDTAAW